jgi:hypothetical protein
VAEGSYDGTRDGDSGSDSHGHSRSSKRKPWSGTTKADDETTMVRIPAGLSRRFDAWFAGQIPDARQRPSKDPYVARVFEHGMAAFEKQFPPVKSIDDRLAELEAS